jgi:TolB-like protein
MNKSHRILVFAALLMVVILARLPAQRTQETINRELGELSRALVESFDQLERRTTRNRLAVMEFENASELAREQNLGAVFAEILTDYLSENTGVFDVYERAQLDRVLQEQELALSDLADQDDPVRIGELTGVHLLVLGSVLQVGNDVQVVARLVETETGQILGSHRIMIPKDVFVEITQVLVELRNSVMLDYMLLFLEDMPVSTAAVAYRYSFSRGLSLGFQVFLGGNHGVIPTTTTKGADPFAWESSFTTAGLAVLFGLGSSSPRTLSWGVQLGPVFTAYHDETQLIEFYEGVAGPYDGGEEIDNWYTLFGGTAAVLLDISLGRSFGIYLGGQFQFFPEQSIEEQVSYKDSLDNWSIVFFSRDILFTGVVVKSGVRYSF